MRTKVIAAIFLALALGALSTMPLTAQARKEPLPAATQNKKVVSPDPMLVDDPHHSLALAYYQNMATFARLLRAQTAPTRVINVDFVRTAVTEIQRSFDRMQQQQHEHTRTMSAEIQAQMQGMIQQMEAHQNELNIQLTALDREAQMQTPNAKKVSTLAASVHTQIEAMAKMHQSNKAHEMKMKM